MFYFQNYQMKVKSLFNNTYQISIISMMNMIKSIKIGE